MANNQEEKSSSDAPFSSCNNHFQRSIIKDNNQRNQKKESSKHQEVLALRAGCSKHGLSNKPQGVKGLYLLLHVTQITPFYSQFSIRLQEVKWVYLPLLLVTQIKPFYHQSSIKLQGAKGGYVLILSIVQIKPFRSLFIFIKSCLSIGNLTRTEHLLINFNMPRYLIRVNRGKVVSIILSSFPST